MSLAASCDDYLPGFVNGFGFGPSRSISRSPDGISKIRRSQAMIPGGRARSIYQVKVKILTARRRGAGLLKSGAL